MSHKFNKVVNWEDGKGKTDNVVYGGPQLAEQFCLYYIISLQVYKYIDYFAKNK